MLLGARYACSRNMCWYSMYTCTRAFGHLLRENRKPWEQIETLLLDSSEKNNYLNL